MTQLWVLVNDATISPPFGIQLFLHRISIVPSSNLDCSFIESRLFRHRISIVPIVKRCSSDQHEVNCASESPNVKGEKIKTCSKVRFRRSVDIFPSRTSTPNNGRTIQVVTDFLKSIWKHDFCRGECSKTWCGSIRRCAMPR